MIQRGEIWWVDFGEVQGSRPASVRPGVVIQSERFNRSRIQTFVVVVVTGNLALAEMPGNVVLEPEQSGLQKTGVANVTQISTVNKPDLLERVHHLSAESMAKIEAGLKLVQGLD